MRNRRRKGYLKYVAAAAVALAAAFAVNGVTAANTIPTSRLGDGSGAVSGYTASSISYTLNATSPQNLDAVAFTLDAAAGTVKVKLVSGGATWYSCTNTSGTNWSCATTAPQATAASVDELRVVAKSG